MDSVISRYAAIDDGDLMLCREFGVAYQKEMHKDRVAYDGAYFDKCAGYEGQDIACKINAGRIALVNKYVGHACEVLDVGVGSGEFIKKRPYTFGFDINEKAVAWLKSWNRWADEFSRFNAFTFWDVLEHVEIPESYFRHARQGAFLFTCLPIFKDLQSIRESRHYRPGEHLYYWTERGFVDWMDAHGFFCLERQDFEIEAGRDSILSFAFRRVSFVKV